MTIAVLTYINKCPGFSPARAAAGSPSIRVDEVICAWRERTGGRLWRRPCGWSSPRRRRRSDARLKHDITLLGHLADGIGF
jgi:hypothetical protein